MSCPSINPPGARSPSRREPCVRPRRCRGERMRRAWAHRAPVPVARLPLSPAARRGDVRPRSPWAGSIRRYVNSGIRPLGGLVATLLDPQGRRARLPPGHRVCLCSHRSSPPRPTLIPRGDGVSGMLAEKGGRGLPRGGVGRETGSTSSGSRHQAAPDRGGVEDRSLGRSNSRARARVDDEAVLRRAVRWRAAHMSAGRRRRRVRAPRAECPFGNIVLASDNNCRMGPGASRRKLTARTSRG